MKRKKTLLRQSGSAHLHCMQLWSLLFDAHGRHIGGLCNARETLRSTWERRGKLGPPSVRPVVSRHSSLLSHISMPQNLRKNSGNKYGERRHSISCCIPRIVLSKISCEKHQENLLKGKRFTIHLTIRLSTRSSGTRF